MASSAGPQRFLRQGWIQDPVLIAILAGALALRVLLVFSIPLLDAPDEGSHLLYVHAVAAHFAFPIATSGEQEFFQPPLYYLLCAPIYRGLSSAGSSAEYGVRLVNTLLGLLVVLLTYRTGLVVVPHKREVARIAAALVAFLPTFLGSSATCNNDVLSILLFSLVLHLLVRSVVNDDWSLRAGLRLAVALAACLYTKNTALVLLPGILVGPLLVRPRRDVLRMCSIAVVLSLLAILPWWVFHNLPGYGNLLAMDIAWYRWTDPLWTRLAVTLDYLTWSFWVAFGVTNEIVPQHFLRPATYALSLAILVGCIRAWWLPRERLGLTSRQRDALLVTLPTIFLLFVAVLRFGMKYEQGQGRYMFPVLSTLAIHGCLGLGSLPILRGRRLAAVLAAGLFLGSSALLAFSVIPGYGEPGREHYLPDYESWRQSRDAPFRLRSHLLDAAREGI